MAWVVRGFVALVVACLGAAVGYVTHQGERTALAADREALADRLSTEREALVAERNQAADRSTRVRGELSAELDTLAADLASRERELTRLSSELENERRRADELTEALSRERAHTEEARVRVAELESARGSLNTSLEDLQLRTRADLQRGEQERELLARRLEQLAGERDAIREREGALERQVAEASAELEDARRASAALTSELTASEARAVQLDLQLAEERQRAAERLEQLEREAAAGTRALRVTEALAVGPRIEGLESELDRLWPASVVLEGELLDWVQRAEREIERLESLRTLRAELTTAAPDDAGVTWSLERVTALIGAVEAFADPVDGPFAGTTSARGWGVARRLAFARASAASLRDPERTAAWAVVADRLARDERFDGWVVTPRADLVPLGPDPRTGLLEFAALATGDVPRRDAAGRLQLDDESAAVLVLVPPLEGWIGAQSTDRDAPNHDVLADAAEGPVQRTRLSPFLIGKYELNQAQWLRLTSETPSRYGPGHWGGVDVDRTHPVTDVSWRTATAVVERHGLRLPTESEWELAARAGSSDPWWTGAQVRSLEDAVNLADSHAAANGGANWSRRLDWLDDGHTVGAPVAAFRGNPFGLHNVHGNVWEWCRDSFVPRGAAPGEVLEDPCVEDPSTLLRVIRGGAFNSSALEARSAHRGSSAEDASGASLGLRLAMDLLERLETTD